MKNKAPQIIGGESWLRDYFAAMALEGILSDVHSYPGGGKEVGCDPWPRDIDEFRETIAETAYAYADAMLKAREAVK